MLNFVKNQRGAVSLILAACIFLAIPFLGLVFDIGRAKFIQTELQFVADAAALGGALTADKYTFITQNIIVHKEEVVKMVVEDVVARNNATRPSNSKFQIKGWQVNQVKHSVRVGLQTDMPTVFLGFIGIQSIHLERDGEASALMHK